MIFFSWKGVSDRWLESLPDHLYELLTRKGAITSILFQSDTMVLSPAKFVEAFRTDTDLRDAIFLGLPPGQAGAVFVGNPSTKSYAILYKWENNYHSCYEGEVPLPMWKSAALIPWMLNIEHPRSGGGADFRRRFGVGHLASQPPPISVAEFLAEARDVRASAPHTFDAVTAFRLGVFLLSSAEDLAVCYDYVRDIPSLCQLAPLQYLLPNPS